MFYPPARAQRSGARAPARIRRFQPRIVRFTIRCSERRFSANSSLPFAETVFEYEYEYHFIEYEKRSYTSREERRDAGGFKSVFEMFDSGWPKSTGWPPDGDDIEPSRMVQQSVFLEIPQRRSS